MPDRTGVSSAGANNIISQTRDSVKDQLVQDSEPLYARCGEQIYQKLRPKLPLVAEWVITGKGPEYELDRIIEDGTVSVIEMIPVDGSNGTSAGTYQTGITSDIIIPQTEDSVKDQFAQDSDPFS